MSHTFEDFMAEYRANYAANRRLFLGSTLRRGQVFCNTLYDLHPALYRDLTKTGPDPFFDESKVSAASEWVAARWA